MTPDYASSGIVSALRGRASGLNLQETGTSVANKIPAAPPPYGALAALWSGDPTSEPMGENPLQVPRLLAVNSNPRRPIGMATGAVSKSSNEHAVAYA